MKRVPRSWTSTKIWAAEHVSVCVPGKRQRRLTVKHGGSLIEGYSLLVGHDVVSASNAVRSTDNCDDLFRGQEADLAEACHDGLDAVEGVRNEAGRRRCDRLSASKEERNSRSTGALNQTDCAGELNAARTD